MPSGPWIFRLMSFQHGPGGNHLLGESTASLFLFRYVSDYHRVLHILTFLKMFLLQWSLADTDFHLHVCDITLKNSQLLRSGV